MTHSLRSRIIFTLWVLSIWILAIPIHAKGVFDDLPGDNSTPITADSTAGHNLNLVIRFLRSVGEFDTASDLETMMQEGTIYHDKDAGGNADTNSDGEITIESPNIGIFPNVPQHMREKRWDYDRNFLDIVKLAKTLFHENIHRYQSTSFKMASNYVRVWNLIPGWNYFYKEPVGHEIEAWSGAIAALGRWSVALLERYKKTSDASYMASYRLQYLKQLEAIQQVWKSTIEDFKSNQYYNLEKSVSVLFEQMIPQIEGLIQWTQGEQEQVLNPPAQPQPVVSPPPTSAQPTGPPPGPTESQIQEAAAKRQEAQIHRIQAIKSDEQADIESDQADEWRELAEDARENAKKNRERAEYWQRQGREDWADDWEEEAQRDDKLAEERDAEADRLDEQAAEDKKRAEDERSQAQALEAEAGKLNPNKQVGSLIDRFQEKLTTLLAQAEARTLSLPKEDEVSVNFIGHGRAAGEIFTCQVTNNTDNLLVFNLPTGMIFQPSNPAFQTMMGGAPVHLEVPPGATLSTPVSGYCLEPGKSPPPAASSQGARVPARFFLIAAGEPVAPTTKAAPAPGKLQWKGPLNPTALAPYQPMVKIVQAGNRLATNGRYARGIQEPDEYKTMVIQRTLWYQATRNAPQPMARDALKLELQKQIEALPAEKRPSPEKVKQLADRIWIDVELTLSEAGV